MSEPRRVGLMQLLQSSIGCQFVIPVYQRNYTWNADREVKQYLSDLTHVLKGDYKNHFLGILIYLEKSIDFSTRELSVIDGQQRLTTTFLTIYAVREIFKRTGDYDRVSQLEGQYLTNPYHKDKIKYKLKPLVADDDVYRCIVEDKISDIDNQSSMVYKNYISICNYLDGLINAGYSANDILLAMDRLYVVCVPISEEDNAQKIFESINATGVKLTAADLIRNFLLMNLDSESQDRYYADYWRKIEKLVSTDSKELELFFRMFLAVKTYTLVPKNSVYRSFVEWVNQREITPLELFKHLLEYAKIYNYITKAELSNLPKDLHDSLHVFRRINSDLPIAIIMEFYRLSCEEKISTTKLSELIRSINTYLLRRSICDMDSQNISKLFPTLLKRVTDQCSGDYTNILEILNQEMIGNNAGTSGSYMPTNSQMHDFLVSANVYKRPALRIILDQLELEGNPAPVDLSKLSIEHLMPQSPTEEWLAELETDEETYMAYLHRLGNLTLAAKPDNSKMSNLQWEYKNKILESTAHLKMNMELIPIVKWTLKNIDVRTHSLIDRICEIFPYPEVNVVSTDTDIMIDEKTARRMVVNQMMSGAEEIKKNNVYTRNNGQKGYVIFASKMYPEGDREKYWFAYTESRFDSIESCNEQYCIFICRNKKARTLCIPRTYIESIKASLNYTANDDGSIRHHHINLFRTTDGKFMLLLSEPSLKKVEVTQYFIGDL